MKREELLSTYLARLIILLSGMGSIWSMGESMFAYDYYLASSFAISAFFIGLCPLRLCNYVRLKTVYLTTCAYGVLATVLMAIRHEYDDYIDVLFIALVLSVIASFFIMLFMRLKYGEK